MENFDINLVKYDIQAGDKTAVFVTSQPQKIPLHNFYEFIWLLKTGLPRFSININFFPIAFQTCQFILFLECFKLFNLCLYFKVFQAFQLIFILFKVFKFFN